MKIIIMSLLASHFALAGNFCENYFLSSESSISELNSNESLSDKFNSNQDEAGNQSHVQSSSPDLESRVDQNLSQGSGFPIPVTNSQANSIQSLPAAMDTSGALENNYAQIFLKIEKALDFIKPYLLQPSAQTGWLGVYIINQISNSKSVLAELDAILHYNQNSPLLNFLNHLEQYQYLLLKIQNWSGTQSWFSWFRKNKSIKEGLITKLVFYDQALASSLESVEVIAQSQIQIHHKLIEIQKVLQEELFYFEIVLGRIHDQPEFRTALAYGLAQSIIEKLSEIQDKLKIVQDALAKQNQEATRFKQAQALYKQLKIINFAMLQKLHTREFESATLKLSNQKVAKVNIYPHQKVVEIYETSGIRENWSTSSVLVYLKSIGDLLNDSSIVLSFESAEFLLSKIPKGYSVLLEKKKNIHYSYQKIRVTYDSKYAFRENLSLKFFGEKNSFESKEETLDYNIALAILNAVQSGLTSEQKKALSVHFLEVVNNSYFIKSRNRSLREAKFGVKEKADIEFLGVHIINSK